MELEPHQITILDFILGLLVEEELAEEYRRDPDTVIRNSSLTDRPKSALLSRHYELIRNQMECESGRDLSTAKVTIILGIPTIILVDTQP